MAQPPDYLDPLLPGGLHHRFQRREIIATVALDAVPAYAIARCADAEAVQQGIVFGDIPVMLREGEHVEALAGAIDVTGGFKAPQPEGIEKWCRVVGESHG